MVCRACDGAFNLSPHYLEEFRETLLQEFGFEPDLEHFAVSGICADCRTAAGEDISQEQDANQDAIKDKR
jgi:Fe2+ or Zn2+ uptake regulation protein